MPKGRPRVNKVTKARQYAGSCGKCGLKITIGTGYVWWRFYKGGKNIRCLKPECRPRPSDLTRAKWGQIYAAMEAFEDRSWDGEELSAIKDEISNVISEADRVMEEYRELDYAEPRPPSADQCVEWADEIESWKDELENWEPEEFEFSGEEDADETEERDQHFQDQLNTAQDLLGQFPL